jgi:2-oxoglutarate ferredoxin oxidoreductase subunit delta
MTELLRTYEQGEAALKIRADWCKGCNLCVNACPKEILALDELDRVYVTDIEKCIFCSICAERCPDFCITLDRPPAERRPDRSRRHDLKESA